MANYSYSGSPGDSALDEVRFWVQDTGGPHDDDWYLTNEEIDYLIATWFSSSGSAVFVAAVAAEVISSKFTGDVSVSADGVSVSVSDLQDKFKRLAFQLREQYKVLAASSTGPILTSGILWDGHYDYSLQPLIFGIGFMDNAEVGRQDYGDRHPGVAPGYEY